MTAYRLLSDLIDIRAILSDFRRLTRIGVLMAAGLTILVRRLLYSMALYRLRMAYALDCDAMRDADL